MSEHVWEIGDWGREHGYNIRYIGMQDGLLRFIWPDGSTGRRSIDSPIEYLPDCTGFDWTPTEAKIAEHVWQWGDWGRTKSGTIVRFVSVWDGGEIFRGEHGAVNCLRDVEYLPECTDWDWKPIEPPEGYRLLADYEVIRKGDKCFACRSLGWQDMLENSYLIGRQYQPCATTKFARKIEPIEPPEGYRLLERGEKVRNWDMGLRRNGEWIELLGDGSESDQLTGYTYARKIEPQYRPFANAAEYEPHRERWVIIKHGTTPARIHGYSNSGILLLDTNATFDKAFERYTFENGEPFGVEQ